MLYNYLKLCRPKNLLISILSVLISFFICTPIVSSTILSNVIFIIVLYTAGANALNDYIDYEIDIKNRPNRVLSLGLIVPYNALFFSIILFSFGIVLTFFLSRNAHIVAVYISLPLILLYNLYFKGTPIIGNVIVSLIIGMSFIFSGYSFSNVEKMYIPSFLAFGLTFIREIVKDISDIKGDKLANLRTFPILFGVYRTTYLVAFLSIVFGFSFFIPFFINYYNYYYLIFLILTVELPLLFVVILLLKKPQTSSAIKSQNILKFSTVGGLISLCIGTL
tara:strand:- start:43 stop:876 length:834 start_codon:yes stop_codon:yes gene_type:complete